MKEERVYFCLGVLALMAALSVWTLVQRDDRVRGAAIAAVDNASLSVNLSLIETRDNIIDNKKDIDTLKAWAEAIHGDLRYLRDRLEKIEKTKK